MVVGSHSRRIHWSYGYVCVCVLLYLMLYIDERTHNGVYLI